MNRRGTVGFVVLSAVLGASFLVWSYVPETRFITGITATGPDEAVLLTRRNANDATAFWVELVAADGSLRWSTELTPLGGVDRLGFTGAVAAGDSIVVLAEDRGTPREVVVALARDSGEPRWRTELGAHDRAADGGRIGPMLISDDERVYVWRELLRDGAPAERIDALSSADGSLAWHVDLADMQLPIEVHRLAPGRLLLGEAIGPAAPVLLDGATGRVQERLPPMSLVCPIPEGILGHDGERPMVVTTDAHVWLGEAEPERRFGWLGPCGTRGSDLVLAIEHRERHEAGIVAMDRDTGTSRWRTNLGRRTLEPVQSPDGRLPRFLPIRLYGSDGGGPVVKEIAIVDLDTGDVVQRFTADDHAVSVVSAERGWIWLPFRRVLLGVDPDTGRLVDATRFTGADSSEPRLDDLRFGSLWIGGTGWARPSGLPWFAFDLTSGELRHVNGELTVQDATAEWQAVLSP